MDTYFIICVIIQCYNLFCCSNCSNFGQKEKRSSFKLTLCPFNMAPSLSKHFLTFWHYKILQAHLVLSLPQPWRHQFLQEHGWSILLRNQDLGAHHCWGLTASRLPWWNLYFYLPHIHTPASLHLPVYIKNMNRYF